ncbi:MAG: S9 family peptidase [Planctomycetes bacterium]|nr:S9 family peptidase [Planctomycetota bacterium]
MARSFVVFVSAALVFGCASHPSGGGAPDRPVLTGEVSAARAEAARAKRPMEIKDLYRCAVLSAPSLSPDGSQMVFGLKTQDIEAGTTLNEIWIANVDGTGARALTSGKKSDTGAVFTPDGRRIAFTSNRSGTSQVWTMPIDGGEAVQLTDFALGLDGPVWSPDGRYIACTTEIFPEAGLDVEKNKRIQKGLDDGKLKVHVADELLYRHWTSYHDGKRTHIVLVDAATGAVKKDLTPGKFDAPIFMLGGGRGYDFSPDGKELCYVQNRDPKQAESTNADLFVVAVDAEIGEDTAVNLTTKNRGWDGSPLYSPDGKSIAFLSQEKAGYESDLKRLAVLDRASKRVRYLTERDGGFDDMINDMRWTRDSKTLVFEADYKGRTPLFKLAASGGVPVMVLSHGTIGGFELTPDGESAIYVRRTVGEPTEIFESRLGSDTHRRLTTHNAAIENEIDFRPAEETWIEGEDGYRIHCFVVKPHGFDATRRYPLILNVHGGPQSQWTDAFRGDWQVYPAKGYVVAFCNPTGSTGYGQAFTDAIVGDYGGRVYRDLMRVTDALEKLPFVDPKRIGLMGWSYGGYMSMWVEGQTDRFACNAAMMGLFDLASFYGATEEIWFPEHDMKGTPWTSPLYERWSPSKYVKNFKTPALVITGELDYRCPYTQSLAYFTALQKMGVPSRLVVMPNAGHWPASHEMAFYYNVHLDFFHKYLGGEKAPYDVIEHARNLAFEKKP